VGLLTGGKALREIEGADDGTLVIFILSILCKKQHACYARGNTQEPKNSFRDVLPSASGEVTENR
jgi:hypothetical protein